MGDKLVKKGQTLEQATYPITNNYIDFSPFATSMKVRKWNKKKIYKFNFKELAMIANKMHMNKALSEIESIRAITDDLYLTSKTEFAIEFVVFFFFFAIPVLVEILMSPCGVLRLALSISSCSVIIASTVSEIIKISNMGW